MAIYDLLLTLGHNSSAILVRDDDGCGKIVCGYEEERLTLKKAESRFPISAIGRCLEVAGIDEVNRVYVSHWAPDGQLSSMSKRHWDPLLLPKHSHVVSTESAHQTHHDMHASAACWYAFSRQGLNPESTMIFVIDGFGNMGEHISIYDAKHLSLVRRFFGYEFSLGLMYQYMTAFMGMKPHEDEYKILGYETLIDGVDIDQGLLNQKINSEITRYLDSYFDNKRLVGDFDPLLRIDALPALQKNMIDRWTKLCKQLGIEDPTSPHSRVVLSYFVQSVLEGVILTLVKIYKPTNLICSGGVFYNVKLNRLLLNHIPGKLCIYPLAGDQGNALGLYFHQNSLEWPGHLNWGVRPRPYGEKLGVRTPPNEGYAIDILLEELSSKGMVNLVRGSMEFGPRALCNTSTLALPLHAIVNRINKANNRSTVMPMAPVMSSAEFHSRMLMSHRVHISQEHMIVALPYRPGRVEDVLGAAHRYPNEFTGRPQVIDGDRVMDELFSHHPVLINTSFNVHGRPIAYSFQDVIENHEHQRRFENIVTIYLEGAS